MIVWINKRLALAIHDRQLAEHGGGTGVRDESLLDSALARPQQLFAYGDPPPDLAALAASLAYGLARNHPFVDGNKRTAAVACETFIRLNSALLKADDLELYPVYIALAEGSMPEDEFAEWLRQHLVLATKGNVNEPQTAYQR
jgi:death on curing protein